jgi:hypothetical protein
MLAGSIHGVRRSLLIRRPSTQTADGTIVDVRTENLTLNNPDKPLQGRTSPWLRAIPFYI